MKKTKKRGLLRRVVGKAYRIARDIAGIPLDISAYHNFIAERKQAQKKSKDRKIRVAFIVQYIPAWNKSEPLYKLLKSDDRFETFLLCVQNGIKNGKLENPSCNENDVYDWFLEHGYNEAINTYEGNEKWIDLEGLNLDYIFYPRPYNSFMPRQYWSRYVSGYTKICSIMYALIDAIEFYETLFNRDFFRNVSLYFADLQELADYFNKKYKTQYSKGVCVGLTFLSSIEQSQGKESLSWMFARAGSFKIIWTPRWTTDLNLGGSNFFTYKDKILTFAEKNPDIDILIRPHPLMFNHLAETGEFSPLDKDEYLKRIDSIPNVKLDTQEQYDVTFRNSNVLITDTSGILFEYFLTGKPVVFCNSNYILTPNKFFREILEACYVVNNEGELFECLRMLMNGNDEKAKMRQEMAHTIAEDSSKSEQKICDELTNINLFNS